MDTTKLIVEYLVAGTLVLISSLLAAASWFPTEVNRALAALPMGQQANFADQAIVVAIFFSAAYGIGIISEYIGDSVFGWLFDRVKKRHISAYLSAYEPLLSDSPIFSSYIARSADERDIEEMADSFGKMRFFVMHGSTPMSSEIAAQINRFRLIRVLFLVELIVLFAVLGQMRFGITAFWLWMFLLVAALTCVNLFAIRSRFNRYCRAIERSYVVLMLDQMKSQSSTTA